MAAHVTAEMGDIDKAEAVGDFLDGQGGALQGVAHILDNILVNPFRSGFIAILLADHRQVLGGDGQFVGIETHGTTFYSLGSQE